MTNKTCLNQLSRHVPGTASDTSEDGTVSSPNCPEAKDQENAIVVDGLCRPFILGMLYHAPKNVLVPGIVVWDPEILNKCTLQIPQRSSNFDISDSDSTTNTDFNLNVDASLTLNILSGQIDVSGSANYLKDKKESKKQSRVTLKYSATTHFEQLSLSADIPRKTSITKIIESGLATHVVTGIEYGATAYFVFDSQNTNSGDVQKIKGTMKAAIKKIPSCSIDGEAKLDLTNEEQSVASNLSVKFYGDFLLEKNPATFKEAVDVYRKLTETLLGSDNEPKYAVPIRVWLLPLDVFDHQFQKIRDISLGLVTDAANIIEDLINIQIRCKDCLSVDAVGLLPPLRQTLVTFLRLCQYYCSDLQRQMAEKCPAIREGRVEESKLREIFNKRDETPFKQDRLETWMQNKEREVNVVESVLKILKGIQVFSTQSEVDKFVMDPGKKRCVGFVFTSLETSDPQLTAMQKHVDFLKRREENVQWSDSAARNRNSAEEEVEPSDSAAQNRNSAEEEVEPSDSAAQNRNSAEEEVERRTVQHGTGIVQKKK
ncbi:hypothetical protein WMY93_032607 [Mugilogobius chulae]|uniref:SNTX thioredoxin-like domain-containing protein n=1 Tax=Mugilogobius chulae TaxID=88201 RepID=A0AAW0MUA7_9GOBI